MRVLLDTHFMLWLSTDQTKLKRAEVEFLADGGTEAMGSAVALWELTLKWERYHLSGVRKGPANPAQVLDWFETAGIPVHPLTPAQSVVTLDAVITHADPFDRMLLAQAQDLDARLLTRDREMSAHPLALQL